jgi:hypothetical protein
MKIRNGFVSNSSSSSFLVCATEKVINNKELRKIIIKYLNETNDYTIDNIFNGGVIYEQDCVNWHEICDVLYSELTKSVIIEFSCSSDMGEVDFITPDKLKGFIDEN